MKARRRITGVIYKDRVTNEAVSKTTGLVDLDKQQVRSRLRWYGHVHRRANDPVLKSTDHVSDPGKNTTGRPESARMIVLNET